MRLADIATILAPHENMTAEALHKVLRAPTFLALLSSQPGRGKTSPNDYFPEEVARVRVLLAARACGLSGTEMETLTAALNQPPLHGTKHPDWAKVHGSIIYPSALGSIIIGAKADQEWVVRLRFIRDRNGERQIRAAIYWQAAWVEFNEEVAAADLLNGETHLGTLTIPASNVVRPILAYAGA